MFKASLTVLALALGVLAQSSTSETNTTSPSSTETSTSALPSTTAGLDTCILNCSIQGVQGTDCVSFTNFTCICTSQLFQTQAAACLQANCTAEDVTTALQLQQQQCSSIVNGTGNSTSSSSSSSSTSTSTTPSSSPKPSSAASSVLVFSGANIFAGAVTLIGAAVGTLVI